MKYILIIILFMFIILGVLNNIEIKKLRHLTNEKMAILKLIDQYMKMYWDMIPKLIPLLKKEKCGDKKVLEKLMMERNHIYERMDITSKLIHHAKIQDLVIQLDEVIEKGKNETLKEIYSKLKQLEGQIIELSKEYERLNTNIAKVKENPLLKIILPFIKM